MHSWGLLIWHLNLALRLGYSSEEVHWDQIHLDLVVVVGRKRVLSQDLAAASKCKNDFLSFALPVRVIGALHHHYLFGWGNYFSLKSRLKPPGLLARGIECSEPPLGSSSIPGGMTYAFSFVSFCSPNGHVSIIPRCIEDMFDLLVMPWSCD